MIINRQELFNASPIKDMLTTKEREHGVSHGLAEAGYDIRIKQEILFTPRILNDILCMRIGVRDGKAFDHTEGRFIIASAIEEFQMPDNLVGVVHDKSTWARHGLSVFNTVIEPGWKGFLTLELVYHGQEHLHIPSGSGIAQILFSEVKVPAAYAGKYQNQEDRPVEGIME